MLAARELTSQSEHTTTAVSQSAKIGLNGPCKYYRPTIGAF
jgi:hypothetical protein